MHFLLQFKNDFEPYCVWNLNRILFFLVLVRCPILPLKFQTCPNLPLSPKPHDFFPKIVNFLNIFYISNRPKDCTWWNRTHFQNKLQLLMVHVDVNVIAAEATRCPKLPWLPLRIRKHWFYVTPLPREDLLHLLCTT